MKQSLDIYGCKVHIYICDQLTKSLILSMRFRENYWLAYVIATSM